MEAPTTELEQQFCDIWQEVLGIEQIGITDDFFRIGGNSILAIQIAHKSSQLTEQPHIMISDIFEYRTIERIVKSCKVDLELIDEGEI